MMKGDHLAFRRAALVSTLGLAIQAILCVVFFVYGRFTGDHAATTASWLLGSGVLVWVALILVFDQQRRERLEALEAEQLAATSSVSSAFDASNDDLKIAARRLATIRKWVLPVVGLVVAAINLTGGILRVRQWDSFEAQHELLHASGWGLALGLGVAVVMFVFARFVSGMGTVKPWGNLRAGAAQAVAAALVGLLIGAAAFLELALSQEWLGLAVPYVVPILMIVLGSETVLHLVLDLYRPRGSGEDARPAFDSRLLGLVAAPDRIAKSVGEGLNYQFGVDVSSSWFYQLLVRRFVLLLGVGLVIGWLLTMVVAVKPHQRGLVLTFGEISDPVWSMGEVGEGGDIGPGLHLKWPWPISRFEIPMVESRLSQGSRDWAEATSGVRTLHLAADPPDSLTAPILWGESHTAREMVNIVQPGLEALANRASGQTSRAGELSLLAIEVPVQYIVRDFKKFDEFAGPGQRERLLAAVGRRVVMQYLGELSIDQVIALQRTALPGELQQRLEAAYGALNNGQGPGIEILFVGANGAHPPLKVAPNFERVVQARQNRESSIEDAEKAKITTLTDVAGSVDLAERIAAKLDELEAVRGRDETAETELELEVQNLLQQAGGNAGEMLLVASSQRWERHMSERGRAAMLRGQSLAYEAAPELFRSKMYFRALSEAMRNARVYLTPSDLETLHIRMELQDKGVSDVFNENAGADLNQ
jgi:membrane protease subunit HflK